jgi:hypothetical protein
MMKIRVLLLCLIMLPTLASAEIYKWKDKDGRVRYSDVPPPSNVQQEALYGKKIPKPTGQPPLAPVEGDATAAMNKEKAAAKDKAASDKVPMSKEEEAAKRAKDAEQQKKVDEAKQAELKVKQENCKVAQASLRAYSDGGRLVKTNEKGEREYLGDADIQKAKIDAQRDVEKYCDS